MNTRTKLLFASACYTLGAGVTHANFPDLELAPRAIEEEVRQPSYPNSNAIAFDAGEASLYPSVGLRLGSIDNVFYDVSDNTAVDSTQLALSPRVDYIALGAKQMLWLGYSGNYAQHSDAEAADFDDHRLSLISHTSFDSRRRLDLEASFSQSHQELGRARTTDFTAAEIAASTGVDTFQQRKLGAAFSYGNPATRGELVFGFASGTLEFTSNETETRQYDRDYSIAWSRLYYRLSPDTRVYGELTHRQLDYDIAFTDDGLERDSGSTAARVGIVWDTSGLWYGTASIANSRRDYDEAALTDTDVILGDVGLTWLVKSYSRVELLASRHEYESTRGDGLAESTIYGVRWVHDWSDRFQSLLSINSVSETEANTPDTDYSQTNAQFRFAPRRWFRLLGGLTSDRVDKSAGAADRLNAYVGVEANF